MKRAFRLVGVILERHPWWVLAFASLITVVAIFGVSSVELKSGEDTLVSSDSKIYRDTQRYKSYFGGDELVVLLTADLETILSPGNLQTLRALESDLHNSASVKSVLGPATLLASLVPTSQDGVSSPEAAQLNPSALFTAEGEINPMFSPVIPDSYHALIAARLVGGMSIEEQGDVVDALEETVAQHPLEGVDVLVAGSPEVEPAVRDSMVEDMRLMVALAVALMVVVLFLVFRARWRLLSLPLVLIGAFWAIGAMGFLSLPLSLVTMAGLPILIGLGADYAIQFHNRYEEESRRADISRSALMEAVTHIGPTVGVAVLATALGFIALLVSSVPMIRDFGIQLTIGVLLLYVVGLFLLNAILQQRDRQRTPTLLREKASGQGDRVQTILGRIARNVVHRPLPILLVAVAASGAGLYLDGQLAVQTDFEKLMPQDHPALEDLRALQEAVGGTREVGILIEGDDLGRPEVLAWMLDYQRQEQAEHRQAIVSGTSLASLVAAASGGDLPPSEHVSQAVASLPAVWRDSVVSSDASAARISFTTAPMPMAELNRLTEDMEADLSPPAGVSASLAGRSAILAHSVTTLTENRLLITLIALVGIVTGLTIIYRNLIRSVLPVVPILLVVGWSSAVMYLLGVELNPLTAVLGSLIIGIGTEFTVLLMERYHEEKARGEPPAQAMVIAVSRIGRAISASGLTVIGGFTALLFSDFPMLRDFGKVTLIDMSLCLASTLVVLPPIIVWLDERFQGTRVRPA